MRIKQELHNIKYLSLRFYTIYISFLITFAERIYIERILSIQK